MSPLNLPATSIGAAFSRLFRLIRSLRLLRPLDALSSLTPCTLHNPLETTRVLKLSAACGG